MTENTIRIIKLQKSDVTVAELVARYQGRAVGFQLPRLEGVLLLLPHEDYTFVTAAIQARKVLPTRQPKTPAEYFTETVGVLHRLEQRYGMTSAEFYGKFQKGTLREGPPDYWEWRARYKSFLTMQERFGFSETEVVNA